MRILFRFHLVKVMMLLATIGIAIYGFAGNEVKAFPFIILPIAIQVRGIIWEERYRFDIFELKNKLKECAKEYIIEVYNLNNKK